MTGPGEIFLPVDGYEDYFISNKGNVLSLKHGKVKQLKPQKCTYYQLAFYVDNIQKTKFIHKMIAEKFIPNPLKKPQVNHIDGNKYNNDISNLEWVTAKENIQHAVRTGLINFPINDRHHASKLNITKVKKIKQLLRDGRSQREIAKQFKISQPVVCHINKGTTWTHVKL